MRYCGSGGPDAVYIKTLGQSSIVTVSANSDGLKNQLVTITSQQAPDGLRLELWYGCRGDHTACKADPPHNNEKIVLGALMMYGNGVAIASNQLKALGERDNTTATAVSANMFERISGGKTIEMEFDSVEAGSEVSLVLINEKSQTLASFTATADNGVAIFNLNGFTYAGIIYAYAVNSNGVLEAQSCILMAEESLHLGKAFYSLDAKGIFSIRDLGHVFNINEEGVIYTDATKIHHSDWHNNPSASYDFAFDYIGDINEVDYIEISYTFVKKCNCGGQDWFHIYSGGTRVAVFSAQDQAVKHIAVQL